MLSYVIRSKFGGYGDKGFFWEYIVIAYMEPLSAFFALNYRLLFRYLTIHHLIKKISVTWTLTTVKIQYKVYFTQKAV